MCILAVFLPVSFETMFALEGPFQCRINNKNIAIFYGFSSCRAKGNDIWGWTDPLDGEEYVIMGLTGGSSFVRVTDPRNPVVMGFLYTRYNSFHDFSSLHIVQY